MDATQHEKNLSVVYGLLDEIKTGKLPKNFGDGFDERTYNMGFSEDHLDKKTRELCKKLQKLDVSKYSLEMQMWWRDHQKADKARLKKEMKEYQTAKAKELALSKLTKYERKLLGLK
jgi:hypothetical protein